MRNAITVIALCLASSSAFAGFNVLGLPALRTDAGEMASRDDSHQPGGASFRAPGADMASKQARYKNAELMVDLAYRPVTQRGSGQAGEVDGFADDVPFATGMTMILPTGWQLYRSEAMGKSDVPATISFTGGLPWPDVLSQLGDRYALSFYIDWYDRTVVLSKGRPGATYQASRIRVIPEPPKPAPKPAPKSAPGAEKTDKPADSKTAKPTKQTPAAQTTIASAAPAVSAAVSPPPAAPVDFKIPVLKGTLHDNVVRLSKLNGWSEPEWNIDGDYTIPSDYVISAKTFPEAMAKLLLLHPIEADVNVGQRRVRVLKEVR